MNLYEHTIVARQDISPSQIKQLTEKYSKIVEKNDGSIVKTESWGLINLSYIIALFKTPFFPMNSKRTVHLVNVICLSNNVVNPYESVY